ncbi:MAG: carbonic anhydrase [Clostridiales bacterium]|nr:carbonic anhydrase [Clostridiales bacterium]
MDYKKVFKSQELRLKVLRMLDFVPDKLMIKIQYRLATGKSLNLHNPTRFTEKIQWYKLYYRDPLLVKCSDKYAIRDYISQKGLEDILVPLYGAYDKAEDIDFRQLPDKFVLKTNNGSHTNILCDNKEKLNKEETIKTLNQWLTKRSSKLGREWSYYDIEPKIVCEKYLDKDENNDLVDYKFFCFNGEPFYLYVITERFLPGGAKLGLYDMDFKKLPYRRPDIALINKEVEKPKNFDRMIEIARVLSKDFPHVRVDLYNIDGKIYFGELTFYNGSGYKIYVSEEFDFIVGQKFTLPSKFK